jgi:MGT family glycosyltransferase
MRPQPLNIEDILPGTKVLFANFPADGHFNPLTALAVHLKNAGCEVRWYTSENYREKANRLQIPFYGFQKALDVSAHTDIDAIFPERKKHKSQVAKLKFDLVHAFILRSPEYYEDIQDIYQEFPFELMVCDITFGAIPFVREKMNIPVMAIGIVPLIETSKDLPPSGLGLMPSSSFAGRLKQAALRFVADKMIFSQPTKVMREILNQYGIDTGNANIFDILIRKSSVVLQSGTPGFEYARTDMSPHIHFAGPLLPCSKTKTAKRWYNEKLKQYENVLLMTQGTVEKDVEKLIVPALEAFKNSDCLVIVTTGGSKTEELRRRFPQDNFLIEDFIPFDDVMPYADAYLTNGGYGGVLLSIKHGLPLVVGGVHEGKNEINARIGYFGLGVNMRTEKPTVLQVRKAVEEVLGNDRYAQNVKKLQGEFRQYDGNAICAYHAAALVKRRQRKPRAKVEFLQAEVLIY